MRAKSGLWILTFLVWLLAVGSAVAWGLQFTGAMSSSAAAPVAARDDAPIVIDPAALARLLGAAPVASVATVAPSAASRYALLGVVGAAASGAALIAIDGKPPRPFRVGAAVEDGLVLKEVGARTAVLAASIEAAPALTLQMPPPAETAPLKTVPGKTP